MILYYYFVLISIIGIIILFVNKYTIRYLNKKKLLKKALHKINNLSFESLPVNDLEEIKNSEITNKINAKFDFSVQERDKLYSFLKKADNFFSQKNYLEAEKLYLKVLSYDHLNKDALQKISKVYLLLEQYSKSIFFLDKFFKYHPKNLVTVLDYALANFHTKRYLVSVNYFSNAITLDPKNHSRYADLGNVFFILENYEDSIKCYEEAVKLSSRNIEYYKTIAKAYRKNNDLKNSKLWYEKILSFSPYESSVQKEIEKLKDMGV
jgi:tetratricopeptide (TPR) repeat protein